MRADGAGGNGEIAADGISIIVQASDNAVADAKDRPARIPANGGGVVHDLAVAGGVRSSAANSIITLLPERNRAVPPASVSTSVMSSDNRTCRLVTTRSGATSQAEP